MSWMLSVWVATALLALCKGQNTVHEGRSLSASGYHLCVHNETRNVSFLVMHTVPYTVTTPCGGWLLSRTCTVTLYRMTHQTEYKTVMERVTRCCSGYVQVGRYCALPVNRTVEFPARPGSCPTADGSHPRSEDCEWDVDCPGWQKCCHGSGRFLCSDPASSANYSENGGYRFNATVTVKTDYQQLMSSDRGHLNHTRLLQAMVTGALQSDVSVYYLSSQPVHPYRTATSLLIDCNSTLSLHNVTSKLHLLLKHIQEVSSVSVEDVDECAQPSLRQCSLQADCNNTVGSYHCACHQGFIDVDPSNPGAHCTADVNVATTTEHPLTYLTPTKTPLTPASNSTQDPLGNSITGVFTSSETSMTTAPSNSSTVAYNSSQWTGSAPYSSVSSTVEPTTACSPPSITSAWSANVTGTSFCVYWSGQVQTNQTYQVVLRKRSEVIQSWLTNQTMMEVRELQPGALYNVTVTPVSCGSQGFALHISVKTDAQTLDATARLTNIEFTADLYNTSSLAYENLTESITEEIYQSLSPEMKAMVDSGQLRIEIRSLSEGSVVVNFTIIVDPSRSQDISNVSTALLHSLMNSTKYTVDKNNTRTNDFNECTLGDNDCSQWAICTNTWASYTCVCLDGFIDNNPERPGRACQENTTTTAAPTPTTTVHIITTAPITTHTTTTTTTTTTIITAPTTTTTDPTTTTTDPTTTITAAIITTTDPTITTTDHTTTTTDPTTTITAAITTTTDPTTTTTDPTTATTDPTTTITAAIITTTDPTITTTDHTTTTIDPTTTITAAITTTTDPTTTITAAIIQTTDPTTTITAAITTTTDPTTTTTDPTTATTDPTTTITAAIITITDPTITTTDHTTTTTDPTTTITATITTTTDPTTTITAAIIQTTDPTTTITAAITTTTDPTTITTDPTTTTTDHTTTTSDPTTTTTDPTTTITAAIITTTDPTTTITAAITNTTDPTTTTTDPTTTTTDHTTTTSDPTTTTTDPTTTTPDPTITPTDPTTTTTDPTTTTTDPTTTTTDHTTITSDPTTTTTDPTTTTPDPITTITAPVITTTDPTTILSALTTTNPAQTTTTAPISTTTAASTTIITAPTTSTTAMLSMTSTTTIPVSSPTTTITAPMTTAALTTATNASMVGAVSVQCRVAAITVTVAKDFLLSNKIREHTLYMGLPECAVNGGNATHAQLTVAWNECGTSLVHNETYYTAYVTLFNTMDVYASASGTVEVPRIRLEAPIMCTYMKSMLISADFGSMGYDMIKDLITGSGSFQVTVQLMNGTMPLPHNYSLSSEEAVVVEVSLNTSSEQIKVVISKCWATPSKNPGDTFGHTFLENSCSLNQYTKVLMNGNSSTSRVSVKIFSFVNLDVIYLHCQVMICVQGGSDTCVPDCLQRTARFSNAIGTGFGSSGPLLKSDEESFDEEYSTLHLVGISCLGIGLTLFFIIGFVCLFYFQRNRIGHYNFSAKPKQENFTYLVFNT